ncbi:F-box domain-containing protein [Chaetomium strumarium]|uniref:F-box domain-containing protein n=1 Tax=Chaetomium strumarium TaxID=1170767 RepID=A0AAJ0M0R0_9PEZI|nr:F-box domain-containing protein [Chaetomium strumarium]
MTQFRGVISGPEGILLTGVGRYDPSRLEHFIAPLDRNKRWSDDGYSYPPTDRFGVASQPLFNGRHGFIFHEACWDLLEQAVSPAAVPLQRLHHVCKSLPIPPSLECPSWGHDYGGAQTLIIDNDLFPWKEGRFMYAYTELNEVLLSNPYRVPDADRLLADHVLGEDKVAEQPPALRDTDRSVTTAPKRDHDCFASLPAELPLEIAKLLPTADVLNARLASRGFEAVFHDQTFWKSRFEASAERAWVFEAQRVSGERDWRGLYRRTQGARIPPGLRNRRGIWGLIKGVLDVLDLVWKDPPLNAVLHPYAGLTRPRAEVTVPWSCELSLREHGLRVVRGQCIAIPSNLIRLCVYTTALGDETYIAGFSFITSAGVSIQLGYRSSSQHSIELRQAFGFRLAVGLHGIRAIQCITGPDGSASTWFGCPDDVFQTERLVEANPIIGLGASFDGCKMLSLAVYAPSEPPSNVNLRNSALWYPSVPPSTLCLHDEAFVPINFYTTG